MKIFLDHANPDLIRKYSPIIDGVTTNPTLIAKEKCFHGYKEAIKEISSQIRGPVSIEVLSPDHQRMIQEAKEFAALSPNIIIKIPVGLEGIYAIKDLSNIGIKTNATLVFSVNQALLAAKSGATYISIFVGRLDDIGHDGVYIVKETVNIIKSYGYQAEVIAASIRHPLHVMQVALVGVHVATIPPAVLDQMVKHPLTDIGLERFMSDWKNGGKSVI